MLRHSGVLVVIALFALIGAGSATADKPIKEDAPPFNASFPPGFGCPFPTTVVQIKGEPSTNAHLDKNGDLRWLHGSGNIVVRVTNDLTQESVELGIGGPGKITFDEAGTAFVNGGGAWLVIYFPGDSPSSRMLYTRGNIELMQTTDGTLTLVSYNGSPPRDVCAELS